MYPSLVLRQEQHYLTLQRWKVFRKHVFWSFGNDVRFGKWKVQTRHQLVIIQ